MGNQRDQLIVGAGGEEEANCGVGGGEQDGGQIAAPDGTPVEIAEQPDGHRQRQSQCQRHERHDQDGYELCSRQLRRADGQGEEKLQRAGALLFAPLAHRQRGHQKDE